LLRQSIAQQQHPSRQYVYRCGEEFVHADIVTLERTSRQTGADRNVVKPQDAEPEKTGIVP
jgi:hypothetical protein